MYQVDPDNNKKQVPKASPVTAYGRAETPAMKTFATRPNYVLINKEGIFGFAYEHTGSVGGSHEDLNAYVTGSVVDDAAGPIRLDINPIAWRRMDAAGATGDVTFVYTGDVG